MLDRSVKSLYRYTFFQNLMGLVMTCGALFISRFLLRPNAEKPTSTFTNIWIDYGILLFLCLLGYVLFKRSVGKNLIKAEREENLITKIELYSPFSIIRAAILGGISISTYLFFIISRSESLYYLTLALLFAMLYFFPTKARVIKELKLKGGLKKEFLESLKRRRKS
ncbi:MAG: hypothetical protein R8P61_01785 [Bacteroidia bacterium]|nr:hypothetical protein [Bacteroidia bacterium]